MCIRDSIRGRHSDLPSTFKGLDHDRLGLGGVNFEDNILIIDCVHVGSDVGKLCFYQYCVVVNDFFFRWIGDSDVVVPDVAWKFKIEAVVYSPGFDLFSSHFCSFSLDIDF